MNIFYCNGAVSIIVASALIREKFRNQKNLLIIEKDLITVIPSTFTGYKDKYYEVVDLIVKSLNYDYAGVRVVNVESTFVALRHMQWPISQIPIANIRVIKNKSKTIAYLKNVIGNLNGNDRLIVSDNSILWRNLYKKQCRLSFIEHGAASYRESTLNNNWKYTIKSIYSFLINANINQMADNIYLSDCGKSFKSKNYNNSHNIKPISFCPTGSIKIIFDGFLKMYKDKHAIAYQELHNIKKIKKQLYIYMPTAIVPDEEYLEYLKQQISQIDEYDASSIFLIKAHGNDTNRDYREYFNILGIDSLLINVDINKYVPVEIIQFYFHNALLIGSYSSSHLYSNWWLNKRTLFTEVPDSSVQRILVKEYGAVYNDMQDLK